MFQNNLYSLIGNEKVWLLDGYLQCYFTLFGCNIFEFLIPKYGILNIDFNQGYHILKYYYDNNLKWIQLKI